MTTKAKSLEKPEAVEAKPAAPAQEPRRSDCVVNDGRCVGRAVNGKVCSYHAMQYDRNGKRRRS